MDIKIIYSLIFLLLNINAFAVKDCRDIGEVEVLNHVLDYKYSYDQGKAKLVSKEKIKRPLVRHWSNISSELFEVYYKYSKKEFSATSVNVKYFHNKKEKYSKDYKMRRLEDNLFQIDNYTFNDGVLDPKFRKGRQVYTFKKNKKEICSIDVLHIFATEF